MPIPQKKYLGNNLAVINGTTGATEQLTAYYPYGGVIADLGTVATAGQPYRFGGKELMTANGLNEYDFGARQYYTAVPGFTRIDPMAEKYPWLSPYLYCANNPVNLTDPTGKVISMPSDSSVEHMVSVMVNIQKITNDELFLSRQDDGNITIDRRSIEISFRGGAVFREGTDLWSCVPSLQQGEKGRGVESHVADASGQTPP